MSDFLAGALFGAGATAAFGLICRAVLHASAERHYRAAYVATLTPDRHERLISLEASGVSSWRQFREQEQGSAAN